MDIKNKTILVTGASSGLGYEIAIQLATNHHSNLVIVARREEKLEILKAQILNKTNVNVTILAADLSIAADNQKVIDHCLSLPGFSGAILNAGVTHFGRHLQLEWEDFQKMMDVNIISVVKMTNSFIQHFENNNNEGRVMIVSSMASLFPVPYQAAYSGTKGFLTNFANALSQEINNPKLSLTVFCPGGIKTEMTDGDKFSSLSKWLEPVGHVAKEGIYAFLKGKSTYVPGKLNKLSVIIFKLLPRSFVLKQTGKIYRKAIDEHKKA
ncbi:MAG: SDR family NAD(P)-dependent oxidoreductase [Saprospiraceae bacterium]